MNGDGPVEKKYPDHVEEVRDERAKKTKRNRILLGLTLFFLLLGLVVFFYWYYVLRSEVTTNDAYVAGNIINVMSAQAGNAIAVYADDTDYVKQGQLLVQLDPTNYEINYERLKTALALAARQIKQLIEQTQQARAELVVRKANLARAREDFERRQSISDLKAVSKEEINHARLTMEASEASVSLAQHQLNSTLASLGNPPFDQHPTIQQAAVALREAYIALQRCQILAPATGFIAKRSVQVGEWITPNRLLMSIIPTNQIWIDANFKETEVRDIRIGQPAIVEVDLYGSDVVYHGKVEGIEAGTGSAFSLIPPQNATGNWIKIVQRLPVRISLNPEELQANPLRIGLSTYVTVDITNKNGQVLNKTTLLKPKFTTSIYNIPIQPVEDLIQEIIQNNFQLNSNQTAFNHAS